MPKGFRGFQKGHKSGYFKGKKHSEETKRRMSLAKIGKQNKSKTKFKKGCVSMMKGRFHSEESRIKMSMSRKGKRLKENNPKWIVDRTKLKKYNDTTKDRRSYACKNWRKNVWERDDFKCKIRDNNCGGRIEAHHILGWTNYPDLRYNINNGITLCRNHHPRKRVEEKQMEPIFQNLVVNI